MAKKNASFLFYLVSGLLTILVGLYLESVSTTPFLAVLGGMLALQICCLNYHFNKDRFVTPLFIFSVMYSGYVLGAFYYSVSDGYFGKFLSFMPLGRGEVETSLVWAIIYASICYLSFVAGYSFFDRKKIGKIGFDLSPFQRFVAGNYIFLAAPLLIVGGCYWYYISVTIAGSLLNSFIYFQLFPHFIAEHKLSTLPYLLYYSGVHIWLLGIILSKKRIGILFLLVLTLGFIIAMSTARITISVTYILSQLMLLYLVFERYRKKIVVSTFALISCAFVLFFLRELSNYYYLDSVNDLELDYARSIIGGGNVADLQQLVIVFKSFNYDGSLLGSSYFDWLRNSIGEYFGYQASSVGLKIHDLYVPAGSGAPTPGAIGEAYANFNFVAPLFMYFAGLAVSGICFYCEKSRNLFVLYSYSVFLICFVFMYPKVDSTMIVNFFWGCVPTLVILFCYYILFLLLPFKKESVSSR
ncbi:hypothetical protein Bb109J_c1524 [Bdellovibrio bacteriovorus]|uniref:O-antigen polymerase n=1 Tax=Bdellovibrio bacteriovorus TaxID=959 RepID=UPI00056FB3A6|nr:O-antigen polymerase [Bdellovibrio bacteriovorus]BEV68104.1 hypothetical protein Bb109J_c1524 [Bdellovibrio bacteriovorus]